MNKINIVGGGPAGVYFALLMQAADSSTEITVFERDKPEVSHGWGIVLTAGTLDILKKVDRETHDAIAGISQTWSELEIYHKGESVRLSGFPYISVSRIELLTALRNICEKRGIPIRYESPVQDVNELLDCDLLVGADGAFSLVRKTFEDQFRPVIDVRNNRFMWLGTEKVFDAFTMMFKKRDSGVFAAEGYRYSDSMSTFIPQCTQDTWATSGLADMSVSESCDFVAELFADELDGCNVVPNVSSTWRQFPHIVNSNWATEKILLLGDALHTAHFSIGSGTRLALEDAIAAARAFADSDDVASGLALFEEKRRPAVERLQEPALTSLTWYENLESVIDLDLMPFAYSAMTRSKAVDLRVLRLQDPGFVERYLQWRDGSLETG